MYYNNTYGWMCVIINISGVKKDYFQDRWKIYIFLQIPFTTHIPVNAILLLFLLTLHFTILYKRHHEWIAYKYYILFQQVIMGGGKRSFLGNSTVAPSKDIPFLPDKNTCSRTDGRDLIDEWIKDKASKQLSYQYLSNVSDINSLDTENTEYILGKCPKYIHIKTYKY